MVNDKYQKGRNTRRIFTCTICAFYHKYFAFRANKNSENISIKRKEEMSRKRNSIKAKRRFMAAWGWGWGGK